MRRIALVALALLAAAPAAGAKTTPSLAGAVRVSFTGSGRETYRDYKEWIYQSTNTCWYDKTVDNTASYSWSTAWKSVPLATLARRIEAAVPSSATARGSVAGSDLHGDCGALEPLAGWAGTHPCADTLQALDSGTLDVSAGRKGTVVIDIQAPRFSLPQPPTCSANPRNSQLTVSIGLPLARVAGLARGKSLTIAVGTSMRGSLVPYAPDYNCDTSEAPYEGVFIFDHCKDTLVWSGTLTVTKL